MNKQNPGNPKRKITISEAEYRRGLRDRQRLLKIKKTVKAINAILGGVSERNGTVDNSDK